MLDQLSQRLFVKPANSPKRESEKLGSEFGIEGQFADVPAFQIANDLDNLINAYSGVAMTFFYQGEAGGERGKEILANKTSFRRRAASIRGSVAAMTRDRTALYEEVAAALVVAKKWADALPARKN